MPNINSATGVAVGANNVYDGVKDINRPDATKADKAIGGATVASGGLGILASCIKSEMPKMVVESFGGRISNFCDVYKGVQAYKQQDYMSMGFSVLNIAATLSRASPPVSIGIAAAQFSANAIRNDPEGFAQFNRDTYQTQLFQRQPEYSDPSLPGEN